MSGMDEFEAFDLTFVRAGLLRVHTADQCAGRKIPCCIHNPSDHHMVTWPQNWRGDRGMMERLCPHGNGHPDPDDLSVRTTSWARLHGCECGCCAKPTKNTEEETS